MSISKDDIQFCICRFIKFSINSGWNLAKTHPFISSTFLFIIFLYAFFPWFLCALIHLLAFLILVFSTSTIYSTSQTNTSPGPDNPKRNAISVTNGRPIVRARSVRQRKSRETSRNNSFQSNHSSISTINNNTVDETGTGTGTSTSMVKDDKSNESSGQKFVNGGEIMALSESSEEDEKEREENNKAVQWTADDEKNLMDLGFSEMERNKRLESLIARRRARKMMSLQIRRTPSKEGGGGSSSSVIAPIDIPKNKTFFQNHVIDQFTAAMPGSAPSVLLPGKDPFDIPYDPFEEKPDLTGGSFDQDFIAPDPKDEVFRRHDSFNLRDHHPWPQISLTTNPRAPESPKNPDAEGKDTEKIVGRESSQSPEFNSKNLNTDCITKEIQRFDDVHEENHNTDIENVVDEPNYKFGSTSFREDKETLSNSLASLNREYDLHNPLSSSHHKPANSMESDMQVEVSNSPPQTIDGSNSSIEDEDGNESTGDISFQPIKNDDVEEIYKLHDEKQLNNGFSRSEDDVSDSLLRSASNEELMNQKSTSESSQSSSGLIKSQQDENAASKIQENTQNESEKQERIDESMSIEDKNTVESTEINEERQHTTEDGLSGANETLELQPTPETISSPITSPRSVLQPKLSMEDMQSEIQQSDTQIIENNTPEEERRESIASDIPPIATVLRENARSQSSSDGLETNLFNPQETSHPSSSTMEAESLRFPSTSAVVEDEITQNATRENITSPVTLVDVQKPVEETNSRTTLDTINDNTVEHYTHEITPVVTDPNEEHNERTQLVNTEETSNLSKSGMEVNSPPSEPKSAIAEDARRRDNTMEISVNTATIADPEKLIGEEIDHSTLDKVHEPHEDVPPTVSFNPNQQGI